MAAAAPIDISNQSTYNGGQLGHVNGFIFHHTGERGTPSDIINTLNQRHLGVQYIMDRDGQVYRALPQGAQGAQIRNSPNTNLSNQNTEGMEIIANDDTDLTPAQLASAKQFGQTYAQQHPGVQFYGHGMVNPGHKEPTEGYTVTNEVRSELGQPTIAPGGVAPGAFTPGSYQFAQSSGASAPVADDNRQLIFNTLTSKEIGLSPTQALGFMWSLGGESGGSLQSGINEKGKAAGQGGYGFAQWTGTRRSALEAFAQQSGKSVDDPQLQADYLKSELLGSEYAALQHLKTVTTPDAAARVATAEFERPLVNNSDARIANGSHVGTIDANGNFVPGDAKGPMVTRGGSAAAGGGKVAAGGGTAAAPSGTTMDPRLAALTPTQSFDMSIGSALASIGTGGGGSGVSETAPEPPAPRMPALEGFAGTNIPNPVPAQFQGLGSSSIGSTLGGLAYQPGIDPESAALTQQAPSITAGAPSMTSLLNPTGTSSEFNYLDPRRTTSPSLSMRSPRLA